MDPTTLVYIGVVAATASAIGGLLGTLATMHVAKKQIHAQVILSERMKWIALLRDSLAQLMYLNMMQQSYPDSKDPESLAERLQNQHSQMAVHTKITLLLNPQEDDHMQLQELMADMAEAHTTNPSIHEMTGIIGIVRTQAQKILKREWERVKKGE